MPRYHLIAARDGEIVSQIKEWPSEEIAETWAVGVLAMEFGLDPDTYDTFDEIWGETDGCTLEKLENDPIASAAVSLLGSLHPIIDRESKTPLLARNIPNLLVLANMAKLALALREAGYSGMTSVRTSCPA